MPCTSPDNPTSVHEPSAHGFVDFAPLLRVIGGCTAIYTADIDPRDWAPARTALDASKCNWVGIRKSDGSAWPAGYVVLADQRVAGLNKLLSTQEAVALATIWLRMRRVRECLGCPKWYQLLCNRGPGVGRPAGLHGLP
jgi:hypothetical protein